MSDEQSRPPAPDLPALGAEWVASKAAQEDLKRRMKEAAIEASKLGIPETVISRQLGVNRLTVRDWLGKK